MQIYDASPGSGRVARALQFRRRQAAPPALWLFAIIAAGVLLYAGIAVLIAPPGERARHFDEGGIVTALSAVFLAMAAAFASLVFLIRLDREHRASLFWFLSACAFLFFSLDELLQFHERLGYRLHDSSLGLPSSFRNWNDVVVIGYGVVAVATLAWFLPDVLRYRRVVETLALGVCFYGIHTLIDSTVEPPTSLSHVLEESAKLYASAFLALGMLWGAWGAADSRAPAAPTVASSPPAYAEDETSAAA